MQDELDRLGPVDYLVVEFPVGHQDFRGAIADELVRLHDSGTIRVMDLVILAKADDGSIDGLELSDLPELDELAHLEEQLAETLAEEDIIRLAETMRPGSVA